MSDVHFIAKSIYGKGRVYNKIIVDYWVNGYDVDIYHWIPVPGVCHVISNYSIVNKCTIFYLILVCCLNKKYYKHIVLELSDLILNYTLNIRDSPPGQVVWGGTGNKAHSLLFHCIGKNAIDNTCLLQDTSPFILQIISNKKHHPVALNCCIR